MLNRLSGSVVYCSIIAIFQTILSVPVRCPDSGDGSLGFNSDTLQPTHLYAMVCSDELYIWNNQILSDAGQYIDTFKTESGLDSIVVLHLSKIPVGRSEQYTSLCPDMPLIWAGKTILESGVYCDTVTTLSGCDSLICLNVAMLDPSPVTMIGAALCPGTAYNWNGRDYRQAGIYIKSYPSESGCDSLVELRIEVLEEIPVTIMDTLIQRTDSMGHMLIPQWPEGIRTDTLPSRFGCDSIVIRNVRY
jgi:hypothetical protein